MWLLLLLLVQPAPVAGPNSRFAWDQYAYNWDVVNQYSFTYLLDDSTIEIILEGVICIGNSPNFVCSAPVPEMSNGIHTVKLNAITDFGKSGESTEFRFRYSKSGY